MTCTGMQRGRGFLGRNSLRTDEETRYYWRALDPGLTEEDRDIVRLRAMPTVDQEIQLRMEHEVDTRDRTRRQAMKREIWRYRANRGNVGEIDD